MTAVEIPFVIPILSFEEEELEWVIEAYTTVINNKYISKEYE